MNRLESARASRARASCGWREPRSASWIATDAKALVAACVASLGLAACAGVSLPVTPQSSPAQSLAACTAIFAALDARIDAEGVRDAQERRIDGFPHLRVNRLLHRLAPTERGEKFAAWIARLGALDRSARRLELANLSTAARSDLDARARTVHGADLEAAIETCRQRAIARDLADSERASLLERAVVPPEYSRWQRIVGLYALTRLPFAAGIERFEASIRVAFAAPLSSGEGRPVRYAPADPARLGPAAVREILRRSPVDALGLIEPSPADRSALLEAFAPAFVVDETGPHDRIGSLYWDAGRRVAVDVGEPIVFTRIEHTLVGGQALLQLVYTAWFRERPADGWLDLLAGHLDGLVWRVTITSDGEPWVFDSMHPCGCYHQFFPTARARARPPPDAIEEWAFSPQRLARLSNAERLSIHLAARTHYIRRLTMDGDLPADRSYRLIDDDVLRSLPVSAGGRRSIFAADGIVAGTERAERFFFWPMGIASPGAMRQWGRHATAFVGERHFDDPDLLERRFALLGEEDSD